MPVGLKRIVVGLSAFLLALLGAALFGAAQWRSSSEQALESLWQEQQTDRLPQLVDMVQIESLPLPVKRYFGHVLAENQRHIQGAELEQSGTFNTSGSEPDWRPFTALQHVTVTPPGLIWNADIAMAPGMHAMVRDSFIDGSGGMVVRLAGLVPLVEQHDSAELNRGSLMRYLAEAVWYPTALLPEAGVQWQAVDEQHALATLKSGSVEVSLQFAFNAKGEVTGIYSPGRYREVEGSYVKTPWRGGFSDYEEISGVKIPSRGEVAWIVDGEPLTYWRGRIERVEYSYRR